MRWGDDLEIVARRDKSSYHMVPWRFTVKAKAIRQRGPGTMLFVMRMAHYSHGLFESSFLIYGIKIL